MLRITFVQLRIMGSSAPTIKLATTCSVQSRAAPLTEVELVGGFACEDHIAVDAECLEVYGVTEHEHE